jgi:nucleoside-diphosphate-sugar epimerase
VTALKESDAYPAMAGRGYGWEPRTPLRVGLATTYAWIKEQFYLRKAGKKIITD